MNEDIIKKLEDYRIKNNKTQIDMAILLKISATQYSRWLKTKCISKSWIEMLKLKGIV